MIVKDWHEVNQDKLDNFLLQFFKWDLSNEVLLKEFSYLRPKTILKVFIEGDNIIATFAIKPLFLLIDGQRVLGGRVEYYGFNKKGLKHLREITSTMIYECESKKIKYIFGLTSNNLSYLYAKHFDFVFVDEAISTCSIRLNNTSNPKRGIKKTIYLLNSIYFRAVKKFWMQQTKFNSKIQEIEIENTLRNDNDYIDLLFHNEYGLKTDIHLIVNNKFLTQYLNSNKHICNFFYRNGKLIGFYILLMHGNTIKILNTAAKDNMYMRLTLLHVINMVKAHNIETIKYESNFRNGYSRFVAKFLKGVSLINKTAQIKDFCFSYKPLNRHFQGNMLKSLKWNTNGLWVRRNL